MSDDTASADLVLEILKAIQRDLGLVRGDVGDLKQQMHAVRTHLTAIQQDTGNIYSRLGTLEDRVDRIEVRLGLVDPAH